MRGGSRNFDAQKCLVQVSCKGDTPLTVVSTQFVRVPRFCLPKFFVVSWCLDSRLQLFPLNFFCRMSVESRIWYQSRPEREKFHFHGSLFGKFQGEDGLLEAWKCHQWIRGGRFRGVCHNFGTKMLILKFQIFRIFPSFGKIKMGRFYSIGRELQKQWKNHHMLKNARNRSKFFLVVSYR